MAAAKQAALSNFQLHGASFPLDNQLLFSSVAALLGSPGQANYSAANAALDVSAQRAQLTGQPTASVQWGAWAGAGMAAQDRSTAARLERLGMGLISISGGLDALEAALSSSAGGSGRSLLAAVPFRWSQFVAVARKPLPQLFAAYAPDEAAVESSTVEASTTGVAAVDMGEVEAAVQAAVRSILGADVDPDAPLMAAGLDSLGAVELRSSLESRLGVQLPSTLVFDYPTVAALTQFLASRLGGAAAADSATLEVPSATIAALLPHTGREAGAAASAVVMLGATGRSPQQALGQLATAGKGIDAIQLVPLDRWNVEAEPLAARFGAYLAGNAAFDAAAFSTSDAEAVLMDPQQRLLLDSVGEALLAGGADAAAAPLRSRGVYVGEQGGGGGGGAGPARVGFGVQAGGTGL